MSRVGGQRWGGNQTESLYKPGHDPIKPLKELHSGTVILHRAIIKDN